MSPASLATLAIDGRRRSSGAAKRASSKGDAPGHEAPAGPPIHGRNEAPTGPTQSPPCTSGIRGVGAKARDIASPAKDCRREERQRRSLPPSIEGSFGRSNEVRIGADQ